ncbi:unnamed protein product [Acanthocheilonema viteae]|uniref:Uncharacterized protein n=1 Tax=Acanthocheilonema viteae TaxID=6277 RepID=A0A498SH28_ACAVI|nr:unnamed protein product [Acanthocheilonema viteae]
MLTPIVKSKHKNFIHQQTFPSSPADRVAEWLRRWTANPLGFPRVAYLINKNLYVWSAVIQAKHLKMLRDREYILLRAYNREMQFSRLMQGIAEDEEYSDNG